MASPPDSTVAMDESEGFVDALWQRTNGLPLAASPAGLGLIWQSQYRFADNLAKDVIHRYVGTNQGAYHFGGPHPLHLQIMRKARSAWNAPEELNAEPAVEISHQYLSDRGVASASPARYPSSIAPLELPLPRIDDSHAPAASSDSHENFKGDTTKTQENRGESEPYKWPRYTGRVIDNSRKDDLTRQTGGTETAALRRFADFRSRKKTGFYPRAYWRR